jgi:DNA-binding beta-propeller fold protein YncE
MRIRTAFLLLLAPIAAPVLGATPAYRLAATVPLGAPDHWDYVVADPSAHRVYVAHGDRVAVLDSVKATLIGTIEGIPGGTHGIAISATTGQGFTDDGRAGQVVAFGLKTLTIVKRLPAADDADAIAADPVTGHVFVVEGDTGMIAVVDPNTDGVVATIAGGEKMEYAVAGAAGAIFVAGEEKGDLLKIDARSNAVVARWSAPGCTSPHGLAYDAATSRLFMGCTNSVMMVVDARDGRVVGKLPIGGGSDAIAFDPIRRRVFSSNGADGTASIYQQIDADHYRALPMLATAVSGRTMAVDPSSGRLFVAAADTDPSDAPAGRPKPRPGTLRVLVFDPAD